MDANTDKKDTDLVFVTGLSGAGISSALRTLEDIGYEVFDNMPIPFIGQLLHEQNNPENRQKPVAVAIDTRTRNFDLQTLLSQADKLQAFVLFMIADEYELLRRFTETRRRHPLARTVPVREGILREKEWLRPLQDKADMTVDTTTLSVHDLRHILEGVFQKNEKDTLLVSLLSFGYKYGIPREADIIMDVRFLSNPHWEKDLKPLTGRDKDVGDFIETDPACQTFIENFKSLLTPLFPLYRKEGKNYLTIALGCTGGRHRSVFLIEKLGGWLDDLNIACQITHRDLKD